MTDHRQVAQREDASRKIWREWVKQRIDQINSSVTVHDILRHGGVDLQQTGNDEEEQFSCPFHGADRKPSARVYPADAQSRSHAWCFVCQERWDVITLWKKFHADTKSFTRVLTEIEREYGLTAPKMPEEAVFREPQRDEGLENFNVLYKACERRLKLAKPAYQQLGDLVGYLSAGQVLDKLQFRVRKGLMTTSRGKEVLQQLLDRIGAKIRQCPDV